MQLSIYISQIKCISPASTTVAMISWKYDGLRLGPYGSRVKWYTPEKLINAVYALVARIKGAWW